VIHGPCGELNSTSSCMKKGYCKFKYAKELVDETTKGKSSYLIYRRHNTTNYVEIRKHLLDNSWVVPYNSFYYPNIVVI